LLSAIYLANYVILNFIYTTLRNPDAVIFVTYRTVPGPGLGRLLANCGPLLLSNGPNKWAALGGFIRPQNGNLLRRFESRSEVGGLRGSSTHTCATGQNGKKPRKPFAGRRQEQQ